MPTPNDAYELPAPVASSSNPSCPPEQGRMNSQTLPSQTRTTPFDIAQSPLTPEPIVSHNSQENVTGAHELDSTLMEEDALAIQAKAGYLDEEALYSSRSHSPSSRNGETKEETDAPMGIHGRSTASPVPSSLTGSGFPSTRMRPTYCSSYLRPGSRFAGTQQSDKQIYSVEVTIKNVDLKESFLCGFLKIEGLTKDHPTLTTYFESEIIGSKYTFKTKHESWGASEKTDMQHWDRFPAWRPIAKEAKKPDFHYKNATERECVFMRWKEYFLVPDHRVREISGASFEGFYYICFNQVQGTISGIYFHYRSEKYQQLELKHVPDRGCFGSFEFR